MGQFDQSLDGFSICDPSLKPCGFEHNPLSVRSHLLDITALISDGMFQVYWTYSDNFYERETIQQLLDEFCRMLNKFIGSVAEH
jgi:non-ribosomal peptide synthase protein (TIGR01720 family)